MPSGQKHPNELAAQTDTIVGTDRLILVDFSAGTSADPVEYAALSKLKTDYLDTLYQPLDSDLTDLAAIAGAKGSLAVHNGTNWVGLGVGSNNQVLTADSAQAAGVKWALTADAPASATYIVQTANATLTNEQILADLATGLVKNTTTTGVLSIAAEGTDYYGPSGTDVAIADGGTGQSTQQAAIDALTNVSAATNEHVLTKDTASGNAIFKAAPATGAPTDATYIVQTANATLTNEQILADLATGLVKNTTTTGVLSIAVQGTDYYAPGGTDVAVADGGTGASTAQAGINTLTNVAAATNEHVLTKDTATGNAIFKAAAGGGGSPGGADTQVQFNDAGAFGGDADLTWNKTTNLMTITSGRITVPGAGTQSERLGALATSSGNFSLAVGYNALASGVDSTAVGWTSVASGIDTTAIGYDAVASGNNSVAVGHSTDAGPNTVAVGKTANASNNRSIAIGGIAAATTDNAIAIGYNATASGVQAVAIGYNSTASASVAFALGNTATATQGQAVSIGAGTSVSGLRGTAIGEAANCAHTGAIALGQGATTTANNQMVVGASLSNITEIFVGKGVTNAAPVGCTVNATGGSGTNIAGAALTIAGGRGTGSGAGGTVTIQTAPAGGSGSTLNALVNVGRFDTSTTAGDTRFLLWDVNAGALVRVSVGANDSGGSGFKVLRVPN